MALTKKDKDRLDKVLAKVDKEMADTAMGGKYAAAMANEGFAGGYAAAIMDIKLYLSAGCDGNTRNYWN